ncbi:SH3 domain-containing protein [Flavobacterium sp. LPB0248]|uniref:SH3 domain-containing protein n=1 Tax=Flavobacterium sp. LPB0248 TaxID=2614441 RepID=UPI0015A62FE3|nr:SH3 domain-containing protein [Flavobacterium sp. LPB0248]QLC64857.1 SH3 domain-containing protein [Flavobacterium sp. LPB0248]
MASCCDGKPKEEGRCTGSAYCSACSNCSRCAHCSNGGSCGVCASYSPPVRYTAAPKATKSRTVNPSAKSAAVSFTSEPSVKSKTKKEAVAKKAVITYSPEDMLAVNVENLKLREGPGNEYNVIENLKKYVILMVIAIDGEWLQVKGIQSGNFGYVNAKYVYKM